MKSIKSIKSLFLLLAIVAAWLSSCSTGGPSNTDLKRYQAELLRYFPYHIGDTCVFKNTENDSSIVLRPIDKYNFGSFPYSNIFNCSSTDKCGSGVSVDAIWNETDNEMRANIEMDMEHMRGGDNMAYYCVYNMWLGEEVRYSGNIMTMYPIANLLSYIPDTLVLPILQYMILTGGKTTDISSQGAYIRLVKDHGLTDFSLDGTTVWHQVKK